MPQDTHSEQFPKLCTPLQTSHKNFLSFPTARPRDDASLSSGQSPLSPPVLCSFTTIQLHTVVCASSPTFTWPKFTCRAFYFPALNKRKTLLLFARVSTSSLGQEEPRKLPLEGDSGTPTSSNSFTQKKLKFWFY